MAYLWEDYSADETGSGVEVFIEFRGQQLPFRIKRALTIDERQKANDMAFKVEVDKKGNPVISKQDQAAFTKEIVRVGLLQWPFEYEPGKRVPLSAANISKLDGALLSEIAGSILGTVEVKKEATVPFEKESDVA